MSNQTENSQSITAGLENSTPSEADGDSKETYCEICKIRLSSHRTYLEHVGGKKHKKKAGVIWEPEKTKKEATARGRSNRMSSHDKFSKHSPQEANIPIHINQQNERSSSKFQKRKNFPRYFDDNPNYADYHYNSRRYHANDPAYDNHSYYGYYDERPYYSSRSYRFQHDQNVFGYREDSFDQHLNESGYNDASYETSNRPTSYIEIDLAASSNDLPLDNSDASKTDSSVSKSHSNSKISESPKHPSNSKSSFKSPSNSRSSRGFKSPSNPRSSSSKSPSNSRSSRSPLTCKPSFSFKSPQNSSFSSKNKTFKSPLGSKSTSPFSKIENLKKQFGSPEASKDSCNLSETTDGEKVEEQKLADKVAHNATRFVYPSTQKDKAVVGHLLNQLHRSKKKQNLTRLKIQSGCFEITDRNILSKENLNSDSVHDDKVHVVASEEICDQTNLHQSNTSEEIRIDSVFSIKEQTAFKSKTKSNLPSKSNDSKIVLGSKTDIEVQKKRKRNNSQSKSRKKGCSDVSCFDNVINQVLSFALQSQDSSMTCGFQNSAESPVLDSSDFQHFFSQSPFIQNLLSSENEIRVKAEPLDTYEEQPESSELQRQNMGLPLNISSVDSLIDLFASGSVKVKQEFDDPLIDAIKTVDPSVLVKACENDPSVLVKACENDPTMKQMSNLIERNFLNQVYETNVTKRPIVSPEDTNQASKSSVLDVPNALNLQSKSLCDESEGLAGINEKSAVVNEGLSESIGPGNPVQRPDVSQPDDVGSRNPALRPVCIDSPNLTQRPVCVDSPNLIQRPVCVDSPNPAQRPDVSQPERIGFRNPIQSSDISRPESAGSHNSAQRSDDSCTPTMYEGDTNSFQEQDTNSREYLPKETSKVVKTESDKDIVPHMEDLVKELKILSSMETDVKKHLVLADEKIAEHQRILEEWKSKKLQYQTKEEELRIKRNNVIQLMQVVLGSKSEYLPSLSETSSSSCTENITDISSNSYPESTRSPYNIPEYGRDVALNMTDSMTDHPSFEETNENAQGSEPDICILDPVEKDNNFPVIDLEAENQQQISDNMNISEHNMVTNIVASSGKKIFDLKSFPAHQTVVNYLKVYGGYLYTCCNDSTAKRFCLNDTDEAMTYNHSDKNVSQLCVSRTGVEKLVVLFTLCSGNNIVSMFAANEGTLLKTYHHINKITCICTGWNLCYIALTGGSVISLNLKEEQEIIKSQSGSLVRIATAHQGGIRVLVTLTISGVISIHHAITGLLIRCLKDVLKPPAHMSVYNDYAFFSSIHAISILNISTGQIERKIPLSCPVTGLVIEKDYIFTSTFRGAIQCYSINHERNVKPLDVANFKAVTCIEVYQNWIFIGNRNGDIAVVKFSAVQQNDFVGRIT